MRPGPPNFPIGFATNLIVSQYLNYSRQHLPLVITLSYDNNRIPSFSIQLIWPLGNEVIDDLSIYSTHQLKDLLE